MNHRRIAALGLVVAFGAGGATGCGDERSDESAAAPTRAAATLAPAAIGDDLKLYENTDDDTVSAFANAGESSLVSDGRVWEIRRADRIVGALQVTTVLPDIDFSDQDTRETVVRQVIPGSLTRIRIDEVEVFTSTINQKAVFVWFGSGVFAVLQLKDRQLEDRYADVATAVIRHQATVEEWTPLPPELDDDEDDER